jgi:N-acetylneuraminic acid mutarotase
LIGAGASMVLHGEKLIVYGGSQGRHVFFGDLFEFDIATQQWKKIETTGAFPKRRCCHTASMVGDKMLVFGGITADFQNQNQQVTNDLLSFNFGKSNNSTRKTYNKRRYCRVA